MSNREIRYWLTEKGYRATNPKVYISGPISAEIPGVPRKERKQRFYACEDWILANRRDWTPVNPLRVEACADMSCGGAAATQMTGVQVDNVKDHSWECWMRYDLKALLECDAIVLLPHWDRSPGANVELSIAKWVGMRVHFANSRGEIGS